MILAYDVTDENSFQNVHTWMRSIALHTDANISILLIGNKADLKDDRVVSTARGAALAEEYNVPFFETSAKSNIGVQEIFLAMAKTLKSAVEKQAVEKKKKERESEKLLQHFTPTKQISLEKTPEKDRGSCCKQ